jgi:hypothetical protein
MAIAKIPDRHARRCSICASPYREEIEDAYVRWETATKICREFKIPSRNTLRLHVQAFNLEEKRDKNIKRCLSTIVEKNMHRKFSGPAVISALALLSKIDGEGRSVERYERTFAGVAQFDGWSIGELQHYIATGQKPARFSETVH